MVLTDLSMPGIGGMEVLAHFVKHYPETPVIVLTGFGTIETAVEAMKRGAYDYLSKPANLDEIVLTLKRAIEHKDLKEENVALRSQIQEQHRVGQTYWPKLADAATLSHNKAGCKDRLDSAHNRGKRDGKRTYRKRHSLPEPAQGNAFRANQLRRHSGRASGK